MINIVIETVRAQLQGLDLVDKNAGLVKAVTIPLKGANGFDTSITIPASCNAAGVPCYDKGREKDLLPGSRYSSVMYFEQQTDVTFTDYKDSSDYTMIFEGDFRIVFWMNQKKLGYSDCAISDLFALTVIKRLTQGMSEFSRTGGRFDVTYPNIDPGAVLETRLTSQVSRSPAIFANYTGIETELLYPFDYLALDYHFWFMIGRECFTDLVKGAELVC